MDGSKSPARLGKLPQPRGTKPSSKEKSNKDAHAQREETRRQGNLNAGKEEHNPGSSGPGKMRGRTSKLTRLTGRTHFGENEKGKAASSHQQQVPEAPESRGSRSTDSSPSTNRGSGSPVVPGTAEKGLREQGPELYRLGAAVCLPAGVKSGSGPLVCRSAEGEAEEKLTVEEGSITEQQLGLRQAEERLHRDYIHRLLKVT